MPILDYKITDSQYEGKDIAGLPDKPSQAGISAANLKAYFDALSKDVIAPDINGLIDQLLSISPGDSGADNIGSAEIAGLIGETIRSQMTSFKALFDTAESSLATHIGDATRHVTQSDKNNWNGKASQADFNAHAARHKLGGADPLTASDIGALSSNTPVIKTLNQVPPNASGGITLTGGTGITITPNPATNSVNITATGEVTPGPHAETHYPGGSDPLDAAQLDAVPTSRQVNGKALTGNITLTAADVGALPDTYVPPPASTTYTATIPTTWAGTGPYTQTVSVPGITAAMAPIVDVVLSDVADTARQQLEAWGMVSRIVTGAGNITVTCLDDKPETAIPIQLKVVE